MNSIVKSLNTDIDLLFATAAELKLRGMEWKEVLQKLGKDGEEFFPLMRQHPDQWKLHLSLAAEYLKEEMALTAMKALARQAETKDPEKGSKSAKILIQFRMLEKRMLDNRIKEQKRFELLERREELRQRKRNENEIAKTEEQIDKLNRTDSGFEEKAMRLNNHLEKLKNTRFDRFELKSIAISSPELSRILN